MSKIEPPDYRAVERAEWIKNIEKVAQELDSGDHLILKRVETFEFRSGHSKEDIIEKINQDPMFAAHFAKAPGRQYLHRNLDWEWLNENLDVKITFLSKKSNFIYCITDDGEIKRFENNKEYKPSRALDFCWQYCGYKFYVARIYAHESGGGQDRGYKEMQRLLENYSKSTKSKIVLIVICNGKYYNSKRMKILKKLTQKTASKCFAVHIQEVPNILEKFEK